MENVINVCKPLAHFVYKYFEKPELLKESDFTKETITSILGNIEKAITAVRGIEKDIPQEDEDKIITLWAQKELILKSLIIITSIELFVQILRETGLFDRAIMLRDRIIMEFSKKALENPEIREAIEKGTIQEELEKRKDTIDFKSKYPKFVVEEDTKYEEIPILKKEEKLYIPTPEKE